MANDSKMDGLLQSMRQGAAGLSSVSAISPRERAVTPLPAGRAGQVHYLMGMVEERFGIHPSTQVEKKLERIFEHTSEADLRAWVGLMEGLSPNDNEWLSLVESLTVHETYFCRDKPMMWMLGGDILPMLIDRKKQEGDYTIRIWSAGCSTGEETYNIVFLVLQALELLGEATESPNGEIKLNPRWLLDIVGTDVSRQVVRTANNAVYADFGMGSFRDMSESRRKFFEPAGDVDAPLPGVKYYRVREFARRWASFRQHNLLSDRPPVIGRDLVICRNVMIYFQDEVKRQVQKLFHSALAQRGILILGGTDVQYWPEQYTRQFSDGGAWYIKK